MVRYIIFTSNFSSYSLVAIVTCILPKFAITVIEAKYGSLN